MLNNLEAIHAVIWAAVIGIAFAVIYTNISRTALSKFIYKLIDDNISSESAALSLKDMKLGKIHSRIVRNAVKNQNGLKRIITIVKEEVKYEKDEAEILLNSKKSEDKYYINENADYTQVKKKFYFEPLKASKIIALLVIVIITAVVATKAVDLFNGHFSTSSEKENDAAENDNLDDNTEQAVIPDDAVDNNNNVVIDEELDLSDDENEPDSSIKPTIPGPAIPTGPSENKELNQ